jgi:hypothetical protein
MKVQDSYNQFKEIVEATQVFLEEEYIGHFDVSELIANYPKCIEQVLIDKDKFKRFIEYLEMTPSDFFLTVITATGCEIKDITKKMSKELRQQLKDEK